LPVQPSRLGAKNGNAGSGLVAPIRAPELEEELLNRGKSVPPLQTTQTA
jgi:hypothetical protein